MTEAVFALGTLGFALGWVLPTLHQLLRSRSASGLSPSMLALTAGANCLWLVVATVEGAVALLLSALTYLAGASAALALATRYGAAVPRAAGAAAVVTVVVMAVVTLRTGGNGLAVSVVVLAFAAARFTAQGIAALRSQDLAGVSVAAWLTTAAEGAVWFGYGIVAGLGQAVAWGAMAAAAGGLVAGRAAMRQAAVRRVGC